MIELAKTIKGFHGPGTISFATTLIISGVTGGLGSVSGVYRYGADFLDNILVTEEKERYTPMIDGWRVLADSLEGVADAIVNETTDVVIN